MIYMLRRQHLPLICLVIICLLAGCGTASNGTASPSVSSAPSAVPSQGGNVQPSQAATQESTGEEGAATRIFSTVNGDIEIPAHPQRIVTQGLLPYFLAFDVKPVGAPSWELEYPHLAGKTDGIENIGVIEAASLEKILELAPDLIVTVAGEMYEQLSKIAPTIVIPYDVIGDAHNDMRLFGKLLGKEEEAEQWLAAFDRKVADSREKINKVVKPEDTFSIISAFDKTHYIYGEGIYRGGLTIYKYLGLKPTPSIQEQLIDAKKQLLEVSFEVIPEYAGNHIFLDVSNGGKLDQDNKLWKSLEAVQKNQVYPLNVDIFWPYDPLAIMMQLDELLNMLGAN